MGKIFNRKRIRIMIAVSAMILSSQALTVFGASEAQAPEGEALSVLESYDETAAVEVQQEEAQADKSDLQALIESATAAQEEPTYVNVVPGVKQAFEKALEKANAVNASEGATQEEVDAAYSELLDLLQMLGYVTKDKSELQNAYDEYSKVNFADYTDESAQVLRDALVDAKAVLDDANALAYEIDDALEALNRAKAGLVEKVKKDALGQLVEEAKGKNPDDYTPESAGKLEEALQKAEDVLKNENATQEEVDKAAEELQKALDELTEKETPVNKGDLQDLLDKAEGVDKDKYTPDSIKELEKEIEDAKEILGKDDATQEEVDRAKEELQDALDSLVEKEKPVEPEAADKTELGALLDVVKNMDKSSYTQESLDVLKEAYDKAKAVYDDPDATQEEVDAAVKELRDAKAALKKKEESPKPADKDDLKDLLDKVKDMDKSPYTPESVKKLEDAYKKAFAVWSDKNATQEEVDAAAAALNKALKELKKKTVNVQTGDETSAMLWLGLLAMAACVAAIYGKKRIKR